MTICRRKTIETWKAQALILLALIVGVILGAWMNQTYAHERPMLSPLAPAVQAAVSEATPTPPLSPTETPIAHRVARGMASWYGESDEECMGCSPDRITASGRRFNEMELTAACAQRWALGTTLTIRYLDREVTVVCTDRGGFEEKFGRILDLSKASFAALAPLSRGVIRVEVEE